MTGNLPGPARSLARPRQVRWLRAVPAKSVAVGNGRLPFVVVFFTPLQDHQQSFGHPGAGGMQGVAFPARGLGVGYVSSYTSPYGIGNDPRYLTLLEATFQCLDDLEARRK